MCDLARFIGVSVQLNCELIIVTDAANGGMVRDVIVGDGPGYANFLNCSGDDICYKIRKWINDVILDIVNPDIYSKIETDVLAANNAISVSGCLSGDVRYTFIYSLWINGEKIDDERQWGELIDIDDPFFGW